MNSLRKLIPSLKFCAVFVAGSVIALIIFAAILIALKLAAKIQVTYEDVMNLGMVVQDAANLIVVLLALKLGMMTLKYNSNPHIKERSHIFIPTLIGVLWFLSDGFIQGLLGVEMDDETSKSFKDLLDPSNPLPIKISNYSSICIIGPILEELLMRAGLLAIMLRSRINPWVAIIASSLIFGIIHFNFAQFVMASIGGIILGITYYKTHSIIVPVIIHILNNTLSTVLDLIYGNECDVMTTQDKIFSMVAILIMLPLCAYLLKREYFTDKYS